MAAGKFHYILAIALFLLFSAFAAAQGEQMFTCPAGQTEDLQCAAGCCEQAGGAYSYSDETCTVAAQAQLTQAFDCERAMGCCEPSGSTGNSSAGCCGSALVLALVGALVFSRS